MDMDRAMELTHAIAIKLKALSDAQNNLGNKKLAEDNMEASLAILTVLERLEG